MVRNEGASSMAPIRLTDLQLTQVMRLARVRREFNASSSIHPIPPNDLCERFAVRIGRQGGEGRAASRPGRHRVRSRGFRFASSLTSDSLRKETALRRTKTYSNRHDAVRLITSDACIGLAESAAEFF